MKRFPQGTSYPEIGESLAAMIAMPPLTKASLVVDQTGVGAAVVDLLRRADIRTMLPVTITSGHRASNDAGWMIPKKALVGVLQILLQSKRAFFSGLTCTIVRVGRFSNGLKGHPLKPANWTS